MARSWERMVQRNSKQVNKQRKKQGKDSIYASSATPAKNIDVYKGRNIILPCILLLLGILYWLVGSETPVEGSAFVHWLGVSLYFILAALLYFRRPFLKVERTRLSTIKFNRERWLPAAEIEKITLSRGTVMIKYKGKRTRWVFSRLINRYDTNAMGERLEQFAKNNHIEVEHE